MLRARRAGPHFPQRTVGMIVVGAGFALLSARWPAFPVALPSVAGGSSSSSPYIVPLHRSDNHFLLCLEPIDGSMDKSEELETLSCGSSRGARLLLDRGEERVLEVPQMVPVPRSALLMGHGAKYDATQACARLVGRLLIALRLAIRAKNRVESDTLFGQYR